MFWVTNSKLQSSKQSSWKEAKNVNITQTIKNEINFSFLETGKRLKKPLKMPDENHFTLRAEQKLKPFLKKPIKKTHHISTTPLTLMAPCQIQ